MQLQTAESLAFRRSESVLHGFDQGSVLPSPELLGCPELFSSLELLSCTEPDPDADINVHHHLLRYSHNYDFLSGHNYPDFDFGADIYYQLPGYHHRGLYSPRLVPFRSSLPCLIFPLPNEKLTSEKERRLRQQQFRHIKLPSSLPLPNSLHSLSRKM
jgi:hypothetical protein